MLSDSFFYHSYHIFVTFDVFSKNIEIRLYFLTTVYGAFKQTLFGNSDVLHQFKFIKFILFRILVLTIKLISLKQWVFKTSLKYCF